MLSMFLAFNYIQDSNTSPNQSLLSSGNNELGNFFKMYNFFFKPKLYKFYI